MLDLDQALEDLGRHLDAARPAGMAAAVAAEIRSAVEDAHRTRDRQPRWRRVAMALAGLVAVGAAGVAVSPAIADLLGLRGLRITVDGDVGRLPTRLGQPLRLGMPVRLADARGRVPYRVLLPSRSSVGDPDEVYLDTTPGDPHLALVYAARPDLPAAATTGVGLLLTEFRGDLDTSGFFEKVLGPDTTVESLTVNGGRAFWLEGRPHGFFYRDVRGEPRDETVRLAGNVLLWEQGPLTVRLESALSRDQAIRIAETVR